MKDYHYCALNHTCKICKKQCCNSCSTGFVRNLKRVYICDRHKEYFFYNLGEKDEYELLTNIET